METRQIVVPGDLVDDSGTLSPGMNTYQEGKSIYALRLGVKAVKGDRVNVISLSGRYEPYRGDMVIGTVAEVGPSNWYIDIGAANDVGMHVNDVPWRVEFGETSKYMAVGDTVLLKIVHVDEMKKAQVSMKDRQCRKLTGGLVLDVSPTKVPRIVGRNGSMIAQIKDATNVRIFVGQNGVVWLDGEPEDVQLALEALRKIEAEAHTTGLTDRMRAWLEERRPSASRPKRTESEDEASTEEAVEEAPRRDRGDRRERDERRRVESEGAREARPPREAPFREARPPRDEPFREERREARPPREGGFREERREREERPRQPRFADEAPARPQRTRDERARQYRDEDEDEAPVRRSVEPRPFEGASRSRFTETEDRPRRVREEERAPPRRERRIENEEEAPRRPRRFPEDEAAPPRRAPVVEDDEEDARPRRRATEDEEDARPARQENGGDSAGRRRRRGGRGRGRGGRKED